MKGDRSFKEWKSEVGKKAQEVMENAKGGRYPKLAAMIESGRVWYEDGIGWVGRAGDGVEVCLPGGAYTLELYLTGHPDPSTW